MNNKPRYATVRKYAKRELVSGNFHHAVFGAKIWSTSAETELLLARTPEEIVYFLDDKSYNEFVELILKKFPVVSEVCSVHR